MMMSQVAAVLADSQHAVLHGNDVLMTGVSKDTRDIRQGDLYIAIKGDRFDGHAFVAEAGKAGAAGALVSEVQALDMPQVKVADTRLALGQLASYWCQQWRKDNPKAKLIGITGSNGKTSVKEMCRKILVDHAGESAVLSTKGNLNNDIGMPLMLLELTSRHEYAVIEMGANHVGEIDYLSSLAKPDVAIVNNVGPAHLEGFGSLDNIARGKAEIYDGLADDGVAVINRDDVYYPFWNDYCADKYMLTFSMTDGRADVFAKQLTDDVYLVITDGEQAELKLEVPGKHNVMNALAAITATSAATRDEGLPLTAIVDSLSQFQNINGRLTALESDRGFKVYDDSYNANPLSVSAAIEVLGGMKPSEAGHTVLVLGDMAELGDEAGAMHHEIGVKARQAGIDRLYTTGVLSANAVEAFGDNGFHFEDKDELIAALDESLADGDVVLVKGSRSAAMEKVVERILTHENNNKRVN